MPMQSQILAICILRTLFADDIDGRDFPNIQVGEIRLTRTKLEVNSSEISPFPSDLMAKALSLHNKFAQEQEKPQDELGPVPNLPVLILKLLNMEA